MNAHLRTFFRQLNGTSLAFSECVHFDSCAHSCEISQKTKRSVLYGVVFYNMGVQFLTIFKDKAIKYTA